MNTLKNLFDKVFNLPYWVRLVMYNKLSQEFINNDCVQKVQGFLTYVPTLSYQGNVECEDRKCGLDGNTYNFLRYVKQGYTLSEISANTFLSLEEVSKCCIFCQEQGFIERAEADVQELVEYIAGKISLNDVPDEIAKLKQEAQNRFVPNGEILPKTSKNNDETDISRLKEENHKLKEKLNRLHEVVQNAIRR